MGPHASRSRALGQYKSVNFVSTNPSIVNESVNLDNTYLST